MDIESDKIYVVGHKNPDTDSICAAIAYAFYKNKELDEDVFPVAPGELNSETQFVLEKFNVPAPQRMDSVEGKKIILVDHSEVGQMLDNVAKAEVFEVIDHHNIGDLTTSKPILMHVEPVGSCSTIVADMFFYHGTELPKNIAGLLLSGILSDTVIFKSPTTTNKDKEIAEKLSKIVGVDPVQYGTELKKAGADLSSKTDNDLLMGDSKPYNWADKNLIISQFETVDLTPLFARKQELIEAMKKILENKNLDLFVFMATDIMKEGTELFVIGPNANKIIKEVFKKELKDNSVWLESVLSRKKQVVPSLKDYLENQK